MESPARTGAFVGRERRSSPRVRVQRVLKVDVRHTGRTVPVHDLSLGGFAIESSTPLEPGTLHYCELRSTGGPPVKLLAQVLRSERVPGSSHFIIRFRFSMIEPDCGERVRGLIDSVAASLGLGPSSHGSPETRH